LGCSRSALSAVVSGDNAHRVQTKARAMRALGLIIAGNRIEQVSRIDHFR